MRILFKFLANQLSRSADSADSFLYLLSFIKLGDLSSVDSVYNKQRLFKSLSQVK